VTSLALEMLVYPVIYFIWRGRKLEKSMVPTAEGDIHE
jgi:Cu(I)/Ag(I) efflux system membrane protein CusA/SilA